MVRTGTGTRHTARMSVLLACWLLGNPTAWGDVPSPDVLRQVQSKVVKIYGAGGIRGLEPYQTGLLISAEGHILTVWSTVLDTVEITVVLDDGSRHSATLQDTDVSLEMALLKIDASDVPYFDLVEVAEVETGTWVLAFSNLFGVAAGDEPVSVQHGCVSARIDLDARRGVFSTPYRGPVYVVDAIVNNPGAAGGALTDYQGRLVGLLGKELRDARTSLWLNYAIPLTTLQPTLQAMLEGSARPDNPFDQLRPAEPWDLPQTGILLVPDVLDKTPPFVDAVAPESPGRTAGLLPDDLIVYVGEELVTSCQAVRESLAMLDARQPLRMTVMRGDELRQYEIPPQAENRTRE